MRWPVMNPGAFGVQAAHGMGDVAGSSHPPGGTEARWAFLISSGASAWRSTGMNPGATVFTVMPNGASSRA
jgi:hypothetical protein